MKVLVSGATGLIGRQLVRKLTQPVILTRCAISAVRALGPRDVFVWEPETAPPAPEAFEGVEVVYHLAGEAVANGPWTKAKKERIRQSRVLGTRHLVETLSGLQKKPSVLVCASAVGIYGSRGDHLLDESALPGTGFLPEVCVAWEREARKAQKLGIRVVCVRFGIVLARDGGFLGRLVPIFKWGGGSRLGSGCQWMSWVHIQDAVGLLLHAAHTPSIRGAINAVAPKPVTNAHFCRALGDILGRPVWFRLPAFVMRWAVGELSDLLLDSQRVRAARAQKMGYQFEYTDLKSALRGLLSPQSVEIRS